MTKHFYTGGSHYYLAFSKGNHELREVINEEDGDYIVIFIGHFQKCEERISEIKLSNADYDYNL